MEKLTFEIGYLLEVCGDSEKPDFILINPKDLETLPQEITNKYEVVTTEKIKEGDFAFSFYMI